MDSRLNRISLLWGVPGLVGQVVGNLIAGAAQDVIIALFGLAVVLGSTVALLIGLAYYAKSKGHSPWWGLFGLLSCIGILVLALLPDRLKPELTAALSIDDMDFPDANVSPFGGRYESEGSIKPE